MTKKQKLFSLVKSAVNNTEPGATLIVYGSFARDEQGELSDLDLLVLVEKEKVSREDQKRIKYPLYEIEFETGTIISPIVFSKKDWETLHKKTPFYENVSKEGQVL